MEPSAAIAGSAIAQANVKMIAVLIGEVPFPVD
jgi:hypothetical protein